MFISKCAEIVTFHQFINDTLLQAIKKEISWNFKDALDTIFQCAENPGKYFSKVFFVYVLHCATSHIKALESTCGIETFVIRH